MSLGIFGPQMLEGRLVLFRVILKFEEVNLFVPSVLTALHNVSRFPQNQLAEPHLAGMEV